MEPPKKQYLVRHRRHPVSTGDGSASDTAGLQQHQLQQQQLAGNSTDQPSAVATSGPSTGNALSAGRFALLGGGNFTTGSWDSTDSSTSNDVSCAHRSSVRFSLTEYGGAFDRDAAPTASRKKSKSTSEVRKR